MIQGNAEGEPAVNVSELKHTIITLLLRIITVNDGGERREETDG